MSSESIATQALQGHRVLIVEDDPVLGMLLEDALADAKMIVVGPAVSLSDAMRLATTPALDCAILDVNLGLEDSFPVAALLREACVPFLFATAHCLPAEGPMDGARVLCKPYNIAQLLDAVAAMLDPSLRPGSHPR